MRAALTWMVPSASFHRLRQSGIDEELSDVIAGFEGLVKPGKQ